MDQDDDYVYDLAKDLLAVGKIDHALSMLLPVVERPDASPRILWLAGHLAANSWRGELAVSLLERARQQVPNSGTIVADLIQALVALRRTDEARALAHRSLPILQQPLPVLSAIAAIDLTAFSKDSARAFLARSQGGGPAPGAGFIRAILAIHDGDWAAARVSGAALLGFPAPTVEAAASLPETPPHYLGPAPRRPAPAGTRIVLATSLSPRGGDAQRDAIATWKGFGDRLVSVNSAAEIAALAPDYPDVAFVETARDGRALVGKPLVYIDSILDALDAEGAAICGIVNADIRLLDAERLRAEVLDTATSALTLCHRIDLASPDRTEGGEYLSGFDAFFFPRERIPLFRGSQLLLGAPWWDYLLPVQALIGGLPIRIPWQASIGHVVHEINWSLPLFNASGQIWLDALAEHMRRAAALPPLAEAFLRPVLAEFADRCELHGDPMARANRSPDALRQQFSTLLSLVNHLVRSQAQRLGTPPPAPE